MVQYPVIERCRAHKHTAGVVFADRIAPAAAKPGQRQDPRNAILTADIQQYATSTVTLSAATLKIRGPAALGAKPCQKFVAAPAPGTRVGVNIRLRGAARRVPPVPLCWPVSPVPVLPAPRITAAWPSSTPKLRS